MMTMNGKRGRGGEAVRLCRAAVLPGVLLAAVLLAGCGKAVITRDDPVRHENKGDQAYLAGDYETALREYNRSLELGSQKLKVNNNIGNVHFRRGQYELAEKYYRMALDIDPTYLFSINNLALTYVRRQNGAEAGRILSAALLKSPGNVLLLNSLSQVQAKQGDLKGAEASLKKAVEMNPDYAIALNNLGDLYLKNPAMGEDPLPFILRAIAKAPDNKLFYDTLGWYYCERGVFDEAAIALGKAFSQEPDNAEVRVHYATVLEWLGKEKEAMDLWQAVMDMPGDQELTTLARRRYWEIKGK
jgi:predicted Zn-dependent protease